MSSVGVLDFGIGNVSSVVRMTQKAGLECERVRLPEQIREVEKLILPGVGHFDNAMRKIDDSGLRTPLERAVLGEGKQLLGICLGAQVLGIRSDEGDSSGLGWLPFECRKFPDSVGRVPHMQWNAVRAAGSSPKLDAILQDSRFYFVHSYFIQPAEPSISLGLT